MPPSYEEHALARLTEWLTLHRSVELYNIVEDFECVLIDHDTGERQEGTGRTIASAILDALAAV